MAHLGGNTQTQSIASLSAQLLSVFNSLSNCLDHVANADGAGSSNVCISGAAVATFGSVNGNSLNIGSGHTNNVLSKSVSLLIPLFADSRSALHVISFLQLLLGLEGYTLGFKGAVSLNSNLVLSNVDFAVNDFTLAVNQNSSNSAGNLTLTVGVSISIAGLNRRNNCHTGFQTAGSSGRSSLGRSGAANAAGSSGSRSGSGVAAASNQAKSQASSHNQSKCFFHGLFSSRIHHDKSHKQCRT